MRASELVPKVVRIGFRDYLKTNISGPIFRQMLGSEKIRQDSDKMKSHQITGEKWFREKENVKMEPKTPR